MNGAWLVKPGSQLYDSLATESGTLATQNGLPVKQEFQFTIPRMRKVPRLLANNGSQVTWILRVHVAAWKKEFHFTIPRLREVPRLPAETEPIVKQDVPLYDPAGAESKKLSTRTLLVRVLSQ